MGLSAITPSLVYHLAWDSINYVGIIYEVTYQSNLIVSSVSVRSLHYLYSGPVFSSFYIYKSKFVPGTNSIITVGQSNII